jgi:hypothetical protein
MSERKAARLRLAITLLLVLNVAVLAYIVLTPDSRGGAATRIEALQINADRIRVLGAANRGPGQGGSAPKAEKSAGSAACLEWGPFAAADAPRAQSALAQLGLSERIAQRETTDASGARRMTYFVREPDSAVVSRVAELRASFPGTTIRAAACPG